MIQRAFADMRGAVGTRRGSAVLGRGVQSDALVVAAGTWPKHAARLSTGCCWRTRSCCDATCSPDCVRAAVADSSRRSGRRLFAQAAQQRAERPVVVVNGGVACIHMCLLSARAEHQGFIQGGLASDGQAQTESRSLPPAHHDLCTKHLSLYLWQLPTMIKRRSDVPPL